MIFLSRTDLILLLLVLAAAFPAIASETAIDIPYDRHQLDNGLTVLLHEDHKAPIVAVNIWYHVGSKNEKTGKTGFAHLFEHLMFNGSENFNDEYFQAVESIGATDLNGTTNHDRTNYFQNVPVNALDRILWLESDRMGHLLGAIDQAKLDEQRDVVKNEKRESENQPYGLVRGLVAKATWPAGHPYSHTVIGSMEDLSAASLEDVHEWFKTYYGPSNAVLSIAGDFDPETILEKVKKYFGDMDPGPPVAHHQAWVAKRTGEQRQVIRDRVPQARLCMVWNVPGFDSEEAEYIGLLGDVLSSGKSSRLYKRLVYDEQIATDVNAALEAREIAGQFQITVTAKPGQDLARIETIVREEMARLLRDGPTDDEVGRAVTATVAGFIRGIERIGGFGGKSDILARNLVYAGDPEHYKKSIGWVREATSADLKQAGIKWLSDGVYILEVRPFPNYTASAEGADRSSMPPLDKPPVPEFPALQRTTLDNGLEVILAERHGVPVVSMSLLVDAGYASDVKSPAGTAALAMRMLDEGTTSLSALEISDRLEMLGANLGAGSDLDISIVNLSGLKENLGDSLDLFADVVLNPAFPEDELDRLKRRQFATIQAEKASPIPMALRVLPGLLYGEGHSYSQPFTGSGTEASLQEITRNHLVRFHQEWFVPNNATLVVAGDITMKELQPELQRRFGNWKKGKAPAKKLAKVELPDKPAVYVMDRPGSIQSLVIGAHLVMPKANPIEIEMQAANDVLGGPFTSRLNLNLREDKHWTYGAGSAVLDARGQRPFILYVQVQGDKTAESISEMTKELGWITGDKPVTPSELEKYKTNQVLALPGSWETSGAVLASMTEMVQYGYPEDYYRTYPVRIGNLALEEVNGAARKAFKPDNIIWLVVGDLAKIKEPLQGLGLGDIRVIDTDGNLK